jgi:hypothetical protein
MESAAIAPQTSALIEVAREAAEELELRGCSPDRDTVAAVLRLMQGSSCFREVNGQSVICGGLPCVCAETIARATQSGG